MLIPQKVNVVTYNKCYYTSLINNKHYLYSFKNAGIASKCVSFLSDYKRRYNMYPPINNEEYVPIKIISKKTTDEDLHISTEYVNNLLTLCGTTNMELLILNNFNYTIGLNDIDVEFSAIDIEPKNIEFCNQFNISYLDLLYEK
jgi:hypothetical protein